MEGWRERHVGWRGGAAELARLAADVLAETGLPADPPPSERLVRDYVQRAILDRPGREGKEARYGFRHLAQLLAARVMTGDGWPLAKVAEVVGSAASGDLLAMVPDRRPPTAAEAAVARMRQNRTGAGAPGRAEPVRLSLDATHARQEMRASGGHGIERRAAVRLRLAPWCEALVDTADLERLDRDTAESLGRALTMALLAERTTREGKKR